MIKFTDRTIHECHGDYRTVLSVMRDEDGSFEWMLDSIATVTSHDILGRVSVVSNFTLHFWFSGDVIIMNTTHPLILEVPDDDVRELSKWCRDCGWKRLCIHPLQIESREGFDFWMRMYSAGLVHSDQLEQYEAGEISRLSNFDMEE